MKKLVYILLLTLAFFQSTIFAQELKPYRYWNFDKNDFLVDQINKIPLNLKSYQCSVTQVSSAVGKAIDLDNQNCLVVTSALSGNISRACTIEFLFKGERFDFLTFGQQLLYLRFDYNGIFFRTTHKLNNGKQETQNLSIPLTGAQQLSYNYYMDNEWHHFVFTANSVSGEKKIWVDGVLLNAEAQLIPKGASLVFGNGDGFRNTGKIDELAFYKSVIPTGLILLHAREAKQGKTYSFNLPGPMSNKDLAITESLVSQSIPVLDEKEFAPGYPNYTIQATSQLKQYPSPRIYPEVPLKRNMSWVDINYLHRELPTAGGKGFGKSDPAKAVEINEELAANWNYYLDIPVLRTTTEGAKRNYSNPATLTGALVNFANKNPQYPVSTILIQIQNRPVHAGFTEPRSLVTLQNLPDKYYLKNAKGTPVIYQEKKWLSPLMPLDIAVKDGKVSKFYLNLLLDELKIPPTLINENGEIFGHMRKEALLKQDPVVWAHFQKTGLTLAQYSGWFQNRLDSTYRATIMEGLDKEQTHFSFYNNSAIAPEFWPSYEMKRNTNRWDNNTVYSTPDFYPRFPDNWQNNRGAFNGYGRIAYGRVKEIELGDKSFSPFVSAGWGEEEMNIRPAQWLGLLKSMLMLGAEFFYTGYFNITGSGGKWPNGEGPYDPRGYTYQLAMPVYAQAIRSWIPEYFEKGELLNPAPSTDLTKQFRFKGKGENELILVRKLGKKYLIYGSIQPISNIKGNVPQQKITTIELEGREISFEIRRQGSLYILNLEQKDPVFFQLDSWHQYEHPWYWDKNIYQEAEVFATASSKNPVLLTSGNNKLDFSSFKTELVLYNSESACYSGLQLNEGTYKISIKGRHLKDKGSSTLKFTYGEYSGTLSVTQNSEQAYSFPEFKVAKNSGKNLSLTFKITQGCIAMDNFIIERIN